jgi:transposase-like protein
MRTKSRLVSRRRFAPAERAGLLAGYHRSGLSQRDFVAQHGLSLATLTKWLRQERDGVNAASRSPLPFAEVPLAQVVGTARWAAEVVRPEGGTVRVAHDAPLALVAQLLGAC